MAFDQLAHRRDLKSQEAERVDWKPFDWFWNACPKKVGKALARVKFDAITSEAGFDARTKDNDAGEFVRLGILKATAEELIDAMQSYADTQKDPNSYGLKDGGRYTLHPATWLNKGRWMD